MNKSVQHATVILLVSFLLAPYLTVDTKTIRHIETQNDVYVISSSDTEFKIAMENFIFHFRKLSQTQAETYEAIAIIYHKAHPEYCLGTRGQHGPGFNYFKWTVGVKSVDEDGEKISAVVEGKRSEYWNYTAYITFFKAHPGLFRVRILTNFEYKNFLGQGGYPQFWAVNQEDKTVRSVYGGSSGWYTVLQSATQGSPPLVAAMRDLDGNYLFSATWLELSGRDSIFGLLKNVFAFHIDDKGDSFGLKTPNSGTLSPGTYLSGDYIVYVWRDPSNPTSGLMAFLNAVASILSRELNETDYKNALVMAFQVILSISQPKSIDYIYVVEDNGYYLKAYVADSRERTRESTEFITHANVLLGAAYYYNRTGDPVALNLCKNILSNVSNFDVFYLAQYGLYSNNWAPGTLDLWYEITIVSMLISAHTLAPNEVPLDADKLKAHGNWLINMAKKCNYNFPVFAHPDGRIISSATEPDAALGYSYLMVRLYDLYANITYLDEGEIALKKYIDNLYGQLYESHLVAMGIAASSRIYKQTNNNTYLSHLNQLSYLFSRWINLHRGLWTEKNVPFTLISAMPGIFTAAFEYGLAKYFIEEATYTATTQELETLYEFYTRFTPYASKYTFPKLLGITSKIAECGKIDADYWVPIEDVYLSYEQIGRIGQEIYGAGSQIIALMPTRNCYNYTPLTVSANLEKTAYSPNEEISLKLIVSANYSTTLRVGYEVNKNGSPVKSDSVEVPVPSSGTYNVSIGGYDVGDYAVNVTITDLSVEDIVYTTSLEFTVKSKIPIVPIAVLGVIVTLTVLTVVMVRRKLKRTKTSVGQA